MMVRRNAICTKANLVQIVPRFISVVPLVCNNCSCNIQISMETSAKKNYFDLSLNSSGVGALVDSGV